jgi:hypothetical protein
MDAPQRRFRIQFNLRWLFVAMTACAFCALVYRLAGAFEANVVGVALIVTGVCVAQRQRWSRWIRVPLLAVAAIAAWMVAVDVSWFSSGCKHCFHEWDVMEVRVFHQPLWSRREPEHYPLFKMVAEDLGAPCPHDYERFHWIRMWGLVWPGPPFFNGTRGLSTKNAKPWYDDDARARVRSLAADEPELGKEFQRALLDHNPPEIRAIVSRVRQETEVSKER